MSANDRVVVLFSAGADAELALLSARRFAKNPIAIHFYGVLQDSGDRDQEDSDCLTEHAELKRLLGETTERALVTYELERGFNGSAIRDAAVREGATLVVVAPLLGTSARERARTIVSLALEDHITVVSVGAGCEKTTTPPLRIGCELDAHATAFGEIAAFVGSAAQLVVIANEPSAEVTKLADAFGLVPPLFEPQPVVDAFVAAGDVIAGPRAWWLAFAGADELQEATAPTVILPRTRDDLALFEDTLSVSDALVLPGVPARIAVELVGFLSRTTPVDGAVYFGDGPPIACADGVLTVEISSGTFAVKLDEAGLRVAAGRAFVPTNPLQLIDASAPNVEHDPACDPIFVRMRVTESMIALREQLPPDAVLIDASAWLDDGRAVDVPSAVDVLRLARLKMRLGAMSPAQTSLDAELDLVAGAPLIAGHEVGLEMDNGRARAHVLASIDRAERTVHWQCYMVEDDPVSETFAQALIAAGARGVAVRLLIDSLYSLHGSFGMTNPILTKLGSAKGVAVRVIAPITGWPTLAGLKQRNHRKMIVVDGERAVVSGRNIGATYYKSFDEVTLTPLSDHRDVPWIDLGAAVVGPIVEDIERAFLREWRAAGGDPFEVLPQAPRGDIALRFVLHDGLSDTRTLETQLALIRHAKERIIVVNTFPLLLELQRALVAAVKRGVRVQILLGNVRPHYGRGLTFAGGVIRELADVFVRSRIDAVIAAGGEVYELSVDRMPDWGPEIDVVFPHVHAKVLISDDRAVAIGSANFDVTAAYWESESLLVIEDAPFVARITAELAALAEHGRRIDPNDESWLANADKRAWISRHWPSLLS